jgi:hypothetical protein
MLVTAIFFTLLLQAPKGAIEGTVINNVTNNPIAGAHVRASIATFVSLAQRPEKLLWEVSAGSLLIKMPVHQQRTTGKRLLYVRADGVHFHRICVVSGRLRIANTYAPGTVTGGAAILNGPDPC